MGLKYFTISFKMYHHKLKKREMFLPISFEIFLTREFMFALLQVIQLLGLWLPTRVCHPQIHAHIHVLKFKNSLIVYIITFKLQAPIHVQ